MASALQTEPKFDKKKKLIDDGQVIEDDEDAKPLEERELAEIVPWNLWRTVLDRLSPFTPFQMLRYYFIHHSTGPSYSYLLFCMLNVALYTGLLTYRYIDDNNYEDYLYQFEPKNRDTTANGFEKFYLPPNTGFNIHTMENVSHVPDGTTLKFELCRQAPNTIERVGFLSPFTEAVTSSVFTQCTTLQQRQCSEMGLLADGSPARMECFPGDKDFRRLQGTPFDGWTFDNDDLDKWSWTYLRVTASTTIMPTIPVVMNFRAAMADYEFVANGDDYSFLTRDWAVYNYNKSWTIYPGMRMQSTVYYQAYHFTRLANWLINGDTVLFTKFVKQESTPLAAYTNLGGDHILFEAAIQLTDRRMLVYQAPVSFVNLIAQLSALLLLMWSFGFLVRGFNKWHFLNFGEFTHAKLPEFYIDSLFDPLIPFATLGLKELVALKKDRRKRVRRKDLEWLYQDVSNLREDLTKLIKGETL